MKEHLVLVAIAASSLAGCGVGRHVQRGVNDYERADYELASERFQDLAAHEDEMNRKGLARYLVYRGLTDYRLGRRAPARYYLARAGEVLKKTPPGTIKPRVLLEVDAALADLARDPIPVYAGPPPGAVVVEVEPAYDDD